MKALRRHVDEKYGDRMLLGEANQWPEDAAAYFGDGDECHMSFHFPLMPRLFMGIHTEDRFPIIDILEQTPAIHPSAQWALFLRNHDELTLEMVTDEERDYMVRVYARDKQARINLGIRRRLAPLLGNSRRQIELMNVLLFSLPGTPVVYYGDEIGMGDNVYLGDRNGVRTPMQWSADRNAGFSRATPQRLYLPVIIDPEYQYEAVNADVQLSNSHSLLWWMRRLIALRRQFVAFGRGSMSFLHPDNRKILAFLRVHGEQIVLVVANLSRFAQGVELDLSSYEGRSPVELFGHTVFPRIGKSPYFLSVGGHGFYWFSLSDRARAEESKRELPVLSYPRGISDLLTERASDLARELGPYLRDRRWFAGKSKQIADIQLVDAFALHAADKTALVGLVGVTYVDGEPETYQLPLAIAFGSEAAGISERAPEAVIARVLTGRHGELEGLLYDAAYDASFGESLLESIEKRRQWRAERGRVAATRTRAFRAVRGPADQPLPSGVARVDQSNTSIVFGDRCILKLYRRLAEGTSPDVEVGRFLTERAGFPFTPPVAGAITYTDPRGVETTLGFLMKLARNEGDAFRLAVDRAGQFVERAMTSEDPKRALAPPDGRSLDLAKAEIPPAVAELLGDFVEIVRLIGRRTAEMHAALASDLVSPDFRPEGFTPFYRRSLLQSMRNLSGRVFRLLRARASSLDPQGKALADRVLRSGSAMQEVFSSAFSRRLASKRIRAHGDYHLGQLLHTGKDFVIVDFEGEPQRSIEERRIKRSPLRDVAGMLRSFHYAAQSAENEVGVAPLSGKEGVDSAHRAAITWHRWVSAIFLRAYLDKTADAVFFAGVGVEEMAALLDAYRLEKALYEVSYELESRPERVSIPLSGILQALAARRLADLRRSAPGSAEAHELDGRRLELDGRLADALAEYRAAVRKDPERAGICLLYTSPSPRD
mgnify:CR=1 FL=1